jgi:hypothetical protein
VGRTIETSIRSTPEDAASGEPAIRAWVDWVLGTLMAEPPYPYSAVLVPGPPAGDKATLRLAGERRHASTGRPACGATEQEPVAVDGTICGAVFTSQAPALVSDLREHPSYAGAPDTAMRSEIVVPVVRDGRTLAVINVESPRVGGLDIADLERLTKVAGEAARRAPDLLA